MLTKECKNIIYSEFKKYTYFHDRMHIESSISQIMSLLALKLYLLDKNKYIGKEITTEFILDKYEIDVFKKNIDKMSSFFVIEKTSNEVCVCEYKKESNMMLIKIKCVNDIITTDIENAKELDIICREIGIPIEKYELKKAMKLGQKILVEQLKEDILYKLFIDSKLPQEKIVYPEKLIEMRLPLIAQRAWNEGLNLDTYISSKMVITSLNEVVFNYIKTEKENNYKQLLYTYKVANNIPKELLISNNDFRNSYLDSKIIDIIFQRNLLLQYILEKWDKEGEYQNIKRKNDLLIHLYTFLKNEDFKFSSEIVFEHDGGKIIIEENPFSTFKFEEPKITCSSCIVNNVKTIAMTLSFNLSVVEEEYFDNMQIFAISADELKPIKIIKDGLTVFEITKADIDNI